MVKGGSPATDFGAGGLRVGDHGFLALVYVRNLTSGNYAASPCIQDCCRIPKVAPAAYWAVSSPRWQPFFFLLARAISAACCGVCVTRVAATFNSLPLAHKGRHCFIPRMLPTPPRGDCRPS
jgi:hypothetical protein